VPESGEKHIARVGQYSVAKSLQKNTAGKYGAYRTLTLSLCLLEFIHIFPAAPAI
jgi:hypothetical protein